MPNLVSYNGSSMPMETIKLLALTSILLTSSLASSIPTPIYSIYTYKILIVKSMIELTFLLTASNLFYSSIDADVVISAAAAYYLGLLILENQLPSAFFTFAPMF